MRANIIDNSIMKYVYPKDGWLYWKENSKNYNNKDSLAGWLDVSRGYYRIKINGNTYYNHRILYQFYHNVILASDDIIDHIDGNTINNIKENLRICTQSQNTMNQKLNINNKSTGIKNISIIRSKNFDYYNLSIRAKNKKIFSKCFRTDKFSLEDVIKIRDIELERLHGEFMNKG